MRVANVEGLLTLFYDGSELSNKQLDDELEDCHMRNGSYDVDLNKLSEPCRKYIKERRTWQQIIVLEGVTVIPRHTFKYCYNIKRVIVANTVVRIERCAFDFCRGLVYIKLSISLEYIGPYVFRACDLSSIYLPPRCTVIEMGAFAYNSNLNIFSCSQEAQLSSFLFDSSKLIRDSPFETSLGGYVRLNDQVNTWVKNLNNEEEYRLHRICCTIEPSFDDIYAIIREQGILNFCRKNEIGITPSQYLKENPFAQITEKEITRRYIMRMMGEHE